MASLLLHPWALKLRNHVRRTPWVRELHQRWSARREYEARFGHALLAAVDARTVVWDIGANVGFYTGRCLERGARHVVCVEPAPAAVRQLDSRYGAEGARVTVLPVALSNAAGTAAFVAEADAATNRLSAAAGGGTIEVPVARVDELVARGAAPAPHVVKIDVEGYEVEVLEGFGALLRAPALRALFVEVHFRLLHERGLDDGPARIESMLAAAGFQTRWLDLSHLAAVRAGARA